MVLPIKRGPKGLAVLLIMEVLWPGAPAFAQQCTTTGTNQTCTNSSRFSTQSPASPTFWPSAYAIMARLQGLRSQIPLPVRSQAWTLTAPLAS